MGKTGRPFTLYTRPRKRGKPIYYVRYKKLGGGWTIAVSTGHTSEGAAEGYALEQLSAGAVAPAAGDVPTFAQWAVGFWGIGGRYDRARRARGYVLSPTYLRIAELTVRKHLSPAFDRLRLTDMSSELLENHFLKVFEAGKVTARTVNSIMSVLRAMLREAHRLGRIPANPMERVSKFKERPRVRGVLSLVELRALFGPEALEKVWKGHRQPYLVAMIAACTGARHGELRGLRRCDVIDGMLSINRSYCAQTGGFKEPKWGSTRVVSLPRRAEEELLGFMSEAADRSPESLVFNGLELGRVMRALLDGPLTNQPFSKRLSYYRAQQDSNSELETPLLSAPPQCQLSSMLFLILTGVIYMSMSQMPISEAIKLLDRACSRTWITSYPARYAELN